MQTHRGPVPVTLGSPAFRTAATDDFRVTDAAFAPRTILGAHAHERAIVSVIVEGGYDLAIAGRQLECSKGVCLVEPPGLAHTNRLGPDGSRNVILELEPGAADGWTGSANPFRDGARIFRDPRLVRLAQQLLRELRAPDAVSPLATQALGLELLTAVTRGTMDQSAARRLPRWLARVQEQLHARLEGPVSLSELAREAGVHRARLSRAFRAHFGCSVGDYHRQVRIAWAAGEIARNELSLSEISMRAGFADQSHFGRVFRRLTGLTPRQYRDAHGDG